MEPAGRVVAITGAAGGIGSALARRFAADGDRLALLDRDAAALAPCAAQLAARGAEALALACDVTDPVAVERAFGSALAHFGGVDVLVNNAGITHLGRFAETDVAVLRAVMEVNFFGAVHCTRAVLPSLVARRGSVVVVSSVAGFAPLAGRAGYAASKHALHGLFDSLRGEWRDAGVHVLLVCPGFTDTAIGAHALGPDGGAPRGVRTTAGRAATPESVADATVDGLRRRRRQIVLTPVGRTSWWLTRVWPAAYERLMVRSLLREEGGAGR